MRRILNALLFAACATVVSGTGAAGAASYGVSTGASVTGDGASLGVVGGVTTGFGARGCGAGGVAAALDAGVGGVGGAIQRTWLTCTAAVFAGFCGSELPVAAGAEAGVEEAPVSRVETASDAIHPGGSSPTISTTCAASTLTSRASSVGQRGAPEGGDCGFIRRDSWGGCTAVSLWVWWWSL